MGSNPQHRCEGGFASSEMPPPLMVASFRGIACLVVIAGDHSRACAMAVLGPIVLPRCQRGLRRGMGWSREWETQDTDMKIDAVVPFHPKDHDTIGWCIQGIRKHLDVGRVLVVGSRECRSLVENLGAVFVDEDSVVEGLTAQSVQNKRWGWYFQQILKLGMADWVETAYYIVVDADTVFLRDVSLLNEAGKPLYAVGTEYHKPYFDVFERLLGFSASREYSFTVHHMVYSRDIVREMRERFPDKPWYSSIVRYVEPQAPWFSESQFSEYDTYGHYVKAMHPEEANIRPLMWANVALEPSPGLFRRLARYYDYCSLHACSRAGVSFPRRARRRLGFELRLLRACLGMV